MNGERIALVTGGNKGIGLETARGLAQRGCEVLVGARDEARGAAAIASLGDVSPGRVEAVRFDVTREADHRAVADLLAERYGRLDILVNNAGVALDDADFADPDGCNTTSTVSPDILRRTFDVNFFGLVALTQTLLPLLRKADGARIVNLSSVLGSLTLHSDPESDIYATKVFAYNASKSAVNAFTVHLAHELRDTRIKVNSAHPGWVQTDMGGPAAPVPVAEGAQTSIYLATLPDDGPSGGFYYLDRPLPW